LNRSRRNSFESTEDDDSLNKGNASCVLGIRGVTLVDWLPKGASFNGAYFDEHILQVISSELHGGEEKKHCLWPLVHMNKARLHTSKRNLARMEELRFKRVPHPPFSPDIAPSDFFFFE
jgi:histone-lysine N-methyltransferase SETMAR